METRRAEAQRDQAENAFTPILRRLFQHVPALLAAVFVDREGECIDYVSALEPYDAKVGAAHMHNLLTQLRGSRAHAVTGETVGFEISTTERELWLRQLGEDYVLIAILLPDFDRSELRNAVAFASHEFRAEVGLTTPGWEAIHGRLSVCVRESPGWQYAPEGFSNGSVSVAISDVLGRWTEASEADAAGLVCFRVRTQEGEELTLVHDPDAQGWRVRS
jgi:predicted regulator of Ras-like GTPase activity (Roadblock/LC7/MglB family)